MKQVFTPRINTQAAPAMCQKYINDASDSPERSPTAKAAYEKELRSGRIRTSELPNNLWVVVWFSFAKGSYRYADGSTVYFKDAWHVAYIKRSGNTVEIHDSEVHSGARRAYASISEVEKWFGKYDCKYVGWSTHCDGREFVKNKEEKIVNENDANALFLAIYNRKPSGNEAKQWVGWSAQKVGESVIKQPEWHTQNHILLKAYPELLEEVKRLKNQISQNETKDSAKATILKKGLYKVE